MNSPATMLLKFGKKEHLSSLQDGHLYLSPIKTFREDKSVFRGDAMEGSLPFNPSKFSLVLDGHPCSFNDLGIPTPTKITGFKQSDNVYISCFAIIDDNILVRSQFSATTYIFSDAFKEHMSQFGSYVLLLNIHEVIERLQVAINSYTQNTVFIAEPVQYRDLSSFSEESDYLHSYSGRNPRYDLYFVKDSHYNQQNEWRILFGADIGHLSPNNGEAYSLDIGALSWSHIYEADWFLKNFQIID